MKRPVASDYDLTWTDHPEIRGSVDLIITGEPWQEYDNVMDRYEGVKKPIFFNTVIPDGDVMKVISHKAEVINQTGARRFYEDQKIQVEMLTALCKDCEIIWVQPERNYI